MKGNSDMKVPFDPSDPTHWDSYEVLRKGGPSPLKRGNTLDRFHTFDEAYDASEPGEYVFSVRKQTYQGPKGRLTVSGREK